MSYSQLSAADEYPVSRAEAKAYLGIAASDTIWDDQLDLMIAAATISIEEMTGRSLRRAAWVLALAKFEDHIALPREPVIAITEISYTADDGSDEVLGTDVYLLDLVSSPQHVLLAPNKSWPQIGNGFNPVRIKFETFAEEDTSPSPTVPPMLKLAVQELVSAWFDNRGAIGSIPQVVQAMIEPYRGGWVAA